MKLLLTGLSHHTAPLEVRERMVFDADSVPQALGRLREMAPTVQEALLLSTCNRTEVLLRCDDPTPTLSQVRNFLIEKSGMERSRMEKALYTFRDLEAVRHFFRMAASLDSMIIGEPQILKQVKDAHGCALREGQLGTILDGLCRRAFQSAKRVRTDTAIGRNPVSISYTACELARQIFGSLAGRAVLVLGAGKMSELTLRHLVGAGADKIFVSTRRYERAMEVARRVEGEAISFERMKEFLPQVDIVISSTAAPNVLLQKEDVTALMRKRRNRPVFFIDIAVPRDIDPAVNQVDNAYLYDIDDLHRVVDDNLQERKREARRAEEIVEREVQAFQLWFRNLAAGPTIAAMRRSMHEVRLDEFERFRSRMTSLTPEQLAVVEEFGRGLVNKILHRPMVELKKSMNGNAAPGQVDLLRRLFGLTQEAETASPPQAREPRQAGAQKAPVDRTGRGNHDT
ncbi:MAG: glutamyl-tRNA reductase [Acidobacteria bacterium]|nr:glutamyl-tRNA reductase [Acidobacteriota bacterium]